MGVAMLGAKEGTEAAEEVLWRGAGDIAARDCVGGAVAAWEGSGTGEEVETLWIV